MTTDRVLEIVEKHFPKSVCSDVNRAYCLSAIREALVESQTGEGDTAEMKLAGIADTINQELRENYGDAFQINNYLNADFRLRIRKLVDLCKERIKSESQTGEAKLVSEQCLKGLKIIPIFQTGPTKDLTLIVHQESDGMCSVQCLEHDIAAQGKGIGAALQAFSVTLAGELALSSKFHDGTLAHIPPISPPRPELPSDEEIEKEAERWCWHQDRWLFIKGAKWFRGQLKSS